MYAKLSKSSQKIHKTGMISQKISQICYSFGFRAQNKIFLANEDTIQGEQDRDNSEQILMRPNLNVKLKMNRWIVIFVFMQNLVGLSETAPLAPAPGLYIGKSQEYSDRVECGTPTWTAMVDIPGGYPQFITWRHALPAIYKLGTFINAFNFLSPNAVMSYHVSFQSLTLTNGVLVFSPLGTGSDINYASFTILILTQNVVYLDLIPLSSTTPALQLAWTGSIYATHYIITTKFIYDPSYLPSTSMFISWLHSTNPFPASQQIQILWQVVMSTPTVNITVSCPSNTYLTGFRIFIVVVDSHFIAPNIATNSSYLWFGDGYANIFHINYGIDTSIFNSLVNSYNCMLGFGGMVFSLKVNSLPKSFYFGISGSDVISVTNANFNEVGLLTFCLASCPVSTFVLWPSYHCLYCWDYISECISCKNSTHCVQCSPSYYVSPDATTCKLCNLVLKQCSTCANQTTCLSCYRGHLALGGCTDMPGCIRVMPISISESRCLACDSTEFQLDPTTNICKCRQGSWLSGQHCSTTPGCVSTRKVANRVQCLFCNLGLNFNFDSSTNTCVCANGFALKGNICADKCGDGRVITSECDDGNLDGGDGCSSTCTVQPFYKCSANGSEPSICSYVGKIYQIALIQTQKVVGKNQGVFTFTFEPGLPLLNKFNISNYFEFQCDSASFQVLSWTYSNGTATLVVAYQSDLETNSASVNFAFDQLYIRHPDVLLNFTVASNGTMLIIFEPSSSVTAVRYVLLATASAAIFLLLIGSCLQKMVGVEVISTIQIVYFSHFALKDYSPTLTVFQELSILGFSDLFLQNAFLNVRLTDNYQRVPFSREKSEMGLIILSALLLSLVCLFSLLKAVVFFKKTNQNLSRLFYESLMVPIVLSLEIPFFLIVFTLQSTTASLLPKELQAGILCFSFATVAVVSFKYIQKALTTQSGSSGRNANPKESYIPSFQLYLLLQIFALFLWLQQEKPFCIYVMLLLEILLLVWYLGARPYDSGLDNLGAMVNILPLVVIQGLWLLRQKGIFASTPQNDVLTCLAVGGLLGVCTFLSLARVVKAATAKIMKKCKEKPASQFQLTLKEAKKPAKDTLLEQEQLQNRLRQNIQNPPERSNIFLPSSKLCNCRELKSDRSIDEALTTMIEEKRKDFRLKRAQSKLERELIQSIGWGVQI